MAAITNERLILSALLQSKKFQENVGQYILPDYFHDSNERVVLEHFQRYVSKYDLVPTREEITLSIVNDQEITESETENALDVVEDVYDIIPSENIQYLIDVAEAFCKDKALFNAIQKTIKIYKNEEKSSISIPQLLQDALSVGFDSTIGHDYLSSAEERYKIYSSPVFKYPFDIAIWNKVTDGGVEKGTLNALAAGINVGKTTALVNLAAMYIRMGYNVFYASNEMSEIKIANRVDANLFNTAINDIKNIDKDVFISKINRMREKGFGKLFIKAYPTGTAHAGMFLKDIRDIREKKKVKIDIFISDYIQIISPMNTAARADKSYGKYKAVAEELRAVCIMEDMVGWTALQLNRQGMASSDPDMTDVGESTGIPAAMDGMWGLVRTEELDSVGQLMVVEMKTRYGDKSTPRFTIGVNIKTQRFYDVIEAESRTYIPSTPKSNETKKIEVKDTEEFFRGKKEPENRFGNFKM